jgi:hypothetical protein
VRSLGCSVASVLHRGGMTACVVISSHAIVISCVIAVVVKYHNMKTFGGVEHLSCIHNLSVSWCDSAQAQPATLSVEKELWYPLCRLCRTRSCEEKYLILPWIEHTFSGGPVRSLVANSSVPAPLSSLAPHEHIVCGDFKYVC